MFITSDIYTVNSTALKLFNCWTDKVTKFDSSSFYNWEQDNMPVFDLDERTYFLWEKLGFPTSSIPGLSLVVSADAPDSAVGCNKNIYRSVSAAVDALPNVINFPVLMEVANFGGMGDLVLNNIKFGPKGSLEIINRNFSRADATASASVIFGTLNGNVALNSIKIDGTANNLYSYVSALSLNDDANSFPGLFDASSGFKDTSCLTISAAVFSSVSDPRLVANCNGYVSIPYAGYPDSNFPAGSFGNSYLSKASLIVASKNSPFGGATNVGLEFKTYDLNADAADSVTTRDVSTLDLIRDGTTHLYLNSTINDIAANGLFYGNRLNKIVVNNCEGPIFLRNFFLDGSGASNTTNLIGVEVTNSNNIYLENIVSVRYRQAGFAINNSRVTLLRGCVAARNYGFDAAQNRLTGNWATKRLYDTFNSTYDYPTVDTAAGLVANNSTITVSSTRVFEEPIYRTRIINFGAGNITDWFSYININYIFDFSKNANGIILNNSTLTGGDRQNIDAADSWKYTININVYGNNECGIRASNSKISFDGRLNVYENLFGIELDSSVFEIDKLALIFNQKVGLECFNSRVIYNKNLAPLNNSTETLRALYFSGNGQHISANNSKILPMMTSGMDAIYDPINFYLPIGVKDPLVTVKEPIPGIELSNGSEMVLVSPNMSRDNLHTVSQNSDLATKGSELSVRNGSKATLIGTRSGATRVFGPVGRSFHRNTAAIYAGNNSTVEINGPTVIAQYGVDLLAEDNSTININPQRLNGENSVDTSSFTLVSALNHTAVELHSTRACVVVDKNSTFNARDLGSFERTWEVTGSFFSNRSNSGIDYGSLSSIATFVSAGCLQFYPNPIPAYNVTAYNSTTFPGVDSVTGIAGANAFSIAANERHLRYLMNSTTPTNDFSAVTNGGMCVRALNGSLVNVHNVNFPCGWWNASSAYYDNTVSPAAGGLCFKTFIWNIADNSQLKASYLSVSGLYPTAAGYVGPEGVWTSGSNVVASGLPSTTPDTSSASILDYFGAAAASANPFGKTSAENYGPFRIYFGINPAANVLTNTNSTTFKVIPQIYSQGYQPSASLICSAFNASALYPSVLQRNASNQIVPSGYYYGNTMTDTNGYTRVLLDESAANVFANAKHCSVGKSGNSKLVSIYYPYEAVQIGSSYTETGVKSPNTFDLQRDN